MEGTTETVATGLGTAFSAVGTALWGQINSVLTTITDNPLLLIPVGLMFAGGGIALAKKLMRKK